MVSGTTAKRHVTLLATAILMLLVLFAVGQKDVYAAGPTLKGVEKDHVITVYYDDVDHSAEGTVREYTKGLDLPYDHTVKKIIFDSSIANYSPDVVRLDNFSGLEEIEGMEYVDTSNVTDMSFMFKGCHNLKTVDLSHFDTSKVTDMQSMFENCIRLDGLDLSSFDTSGVTNMDNMFRKCSSLTKLDLSGFDTPNLTGMRGTFEDCSSLQELDLSGFDTSGCDDMTCLFGDCSSLKELDLSSFDTYNVIMADEMFCSCSSLETIYVGEKWTEIECVKGIAMFLGCTSLVGGAGTVYDSAHTDSFPATIDGGATSPGYLTAKSVTAPGSDKKNIADAELDYQVDSAKQTIDITLRYDGEVLTQGVDYIVKSMFSEQIKDPSGGTSSRNIVPAYQAIEIIGINGWYGTIKKYADLGDKGYTAYKTTTHGPASGYVMKYLPGTSDTVNNLPAKDTISQGDMYTVSATIPEREGYEFAGWTLDYAVGEKTNYRVSYSSPSINIYAEEQWVGTVVRADAPNSVGGDTYFPDTSPDKKSKSIELKATGNRITFRYMNFTY